jgi:hypothetical protein
MLLLSKGPNIVGISLPSPEDENGSIFQLLVFYSYLEIRAMDKVQKSSDSDLLYSNE